jgi:colanic acid biosynthesis glycosyl transferase WcaI
VHVLFINQFYHPDTVATAQLLSDLATTLSGWGHSVTVICGQSGGSSSVDGVNVIRVGNREFSRNPAARVASYATFLWGAARAALKVSDPDVVVTLTTPPFTSVIGNVVKHRSAARHYIWEMDLYPDVAADLNVLGRRSLATRMLCWFANLQRRRADGIIALGDCMRERLESHGLASEQIHVCENWADSGLIHPLPSPTDGVMRILYSGNFGLAHDAETIQSAMVRLNADRRFQFLFGGGGPRHAELVEFSTRHKLENIRFLPYQPRENLSATFGSVNIGLVTQRAECAGAVVPSKVYALMAARRPYLFIGPRTAMPARLIGRCGCGWQIDPGDAAGLIQLLDRLAETPQLVHRAGERAYAAFLANYDLPIGVARIADVIGVEAPRVAAKACEPSAAA